MEILEIERYSDLPERYTGVACFANGTKIWYKDGIRHNLNGPAIKYADGGMVWFKEGNKHRVGGPAVENPDGTKEWWFEGNLHRTDGHAAEYENGFSKYWYIHGKIYTATNIEYCFQTSIYLKTEKGKYGIDWLKFLTETGIEEFPIIPGMKQHKNFRQVFNKYNIKK